MPSLPRRRPLQVFLSYSHDDADHAAQLVDHLSGLREKGFIHIWRDADLTPGEEWEPEILRALETADVVLLLVSSSSMASPYVRGVEMHTALERHRAGQARVIPILVRPYRFDEEAYAGLQLLPLDAKRRPHPITRWSNRDSAYVQVVDGVRGAVEHLWQSMAAGRAEQGPREKNGGPPVPPADVLAPAAPAAPAPVPAVRVAAAGQELPLPRRPHFLDVDLRLERILSGYRVVVLRGGGAGMPEPVRMDLRLGEVMPLAERFPQGGLDAEGAAQLGTQLYHTLFAPAIRRAWERRQEMMDPGTVLRLRLEILAPELVGLPWELLRVEEEHHEPYPLALSPRRAVLRWREGDSVPPAQLTFPLRVLLAVEGGRSEVRRRAKEMRALLAELYESRRMVVKTRGVRSLDDLGKLKKGRYDVVHYVGQGGALVSASGSESEEAVLARVFDGAPVRLLVLTAVDGDSPDLAAVLGTAHAAFDAGLTAVLATHGVLHDAAYVALLRELYTGVCDGWAVESCVASARREILRTTAADAADWAVPALFSRAAEGRLWDVPPRQDGARLHAARSGAGRRVVDNLPALDVLPLVGRDEELRELRARLSVRDPSVVVQLVGEGGSGRSALAYHAAWEFLGLSRANPAAEEGFDGVIRVSGRNGSPSTTRPWQLRGESPWSMDDLYATVAAALDRVEMGEVRPEDRMAVLQDVLRQGRYLLVLDDADLVADRRRDEFLRALRRPSKVLLVCRTSMAAAAVTVRVPLLKAEDAVALFRADAECEGVPGLEQAGRKGLLELVESAGRLPFVLRWAVAQLRDFPRPLSELQALLQRAAGAPLVDYCVHVSIEQLAAPERRLFLGFALYPQPTTAAAAATAAGIGEYFHLALERLQRLRLVREAGLRGRYRTILRARRHAYLLLEQDRTWMQRATQRAVDFVLQTLSRDRDSLEGEVGNIMWAAQQAFEAERWRVVVDMRPLLDEFLYSRGYYNDALLLGERAFDAADRLADLNQRAWCAVYPLARVHLAQGNLDDALRWSGRALALFEQDRNTDGEPNRFGQGHACRYLARALQAQGERERAETLFRQGLEYAQHYQERPDDFDLQAHLISGLATIAQEYGETGKAEELFRAALELYRQAGDAVGIATMLDHLGSLAIERGALDDARGLLQAALEAVGDRVGWHDRRGRILLSLALLAERCGDLSEARGRLQEARGLVYRRGADVERIEAAALRIEPPSPDGAHA